MPEYEDSKKNRGCVASFQRMTTAKQSGHHVYITGLRGILVVQSFFWTFFVTFIPTLASSATVGPEYQVILRKIFSVPFWNESFIYNFFVILSMRTICVSFLTNPTGQTYAATVIRRTVRMVVIMAVGSGIATLILAQIGTRFIDDFKTRLPNDSVMTPATARDVLMGFNSIFDLFWLTSDFFSQAANTFWPTATMWVPSVIYTQSFTVYFLMVILPYTRPEWHVKGMGLFALGCFWMGKWGWYSATGLIFADIAISTPLKSGFKAGWKVRNDWHVPYWAVALVFAAIGISLKYAFVARPHDVNSLLVLQPYLDLSENFSRSQYVKNGPYARLDDWFVIVAVMIVVELFEPVQYFLSFKPLVWIGERSFSVFVAQGIVFWTGGIKLWLALNNAGVNTAGANTLVFIVGSLVIAVFSEMFYITIDLPSQWMARKTYLWLVN